MVVYTTNYCACGEHAILQTVSLMCKDCYDEWSDKLVFRVESGRDAYTEDCVYKLSKQSKQYI